MKYALVTGGSRGIGKAISLELNKMGYHVLINFRSNHQAAEQTLTEIRNLGGDGTLLPFNVADHQKSTEIIEQWLDDHPEECIEVIVNNAGIRKDNLMVFMSDEEWDQVMDIHLGGFFHITRALLKPMIRNKFGRIINIVSLSGLRGMAGQTNYSAAKAAIIGASKALAQEVGRRNITVNCIAPGFIDTEMIEDIDPALFKKMIPMRRFGKVEEVAALAAFLAGPGSAYITGEVINVNGGLYM